MAVCPYGKGTLPRGPRGRDSTRGGDRGGRSCFLTLWTGNGSATVYFEFLRLFMGEEGLLGCSFFLSLNITPPRRHATHGQTDPSGSPPALVG